MLHTVECLISIIQRMLAAHCPCLMAVCESAVVAVTVWAWSWLTSSEAGWLLLPRIYGGDMHLAGWVPISGMFLSSNSLRVLQTVLETGCKVACMAEQQ